MLNHLLLKFHVALKKIALSDYIPRNPKIIGLINIFMGFIVVIAALFFIRDILSKIFPPKDNPLSREMKVQAAPRMGLMDYDLIMKKNPFGFPAGDLKAISAGAGPSLSQTEISLMGTIAGRRDASYAIFADGTGQQEVFRPGERVFGLGRLKQVEKARVIINSGGKDIVIELSEIAPVKEIKAGVGPVSAFGRKTGATAYQVDQRRVQQAIEKPDQIMTDARFVPHIVDGRQQGFILREVKPGGVYQSLGLQNEDVLLRINEYDISTPDKALQAFIALRGLDRADLDILRNGSKMTMTYQIR